MANGGQQSGDVLSGILGLGLLFWVGSCVFGGSDEPAASAAPAQAAAAPATPTVLASAFNDAFAPESAKVSKETRANAFSYIASTINAAGHLCARILEAQKIDSVQYAVRCVESRSGEGVVDYQVNSEGGQVYPL